MSQPATASALLAGFPVVTEVAVLWADEDGFGHVNNVAYLRWCDNARVDYLRRVGLLPELPPRGIGPIVASQTCNYRHPLHHPDKVLVGARVIDLGNSSFRLDHLIVSCTTGKLAAEVETTMVTIDYATGKPVPIPAHVRQSIAELEGRSFDR